MGLQVPGRNIGVLVCGLILPQPEVASVLLSDSTLLSSLLLARLCQRLTPMKGQRSPVKCSAWTAEHKTPVKMLLHYYPY